MSCQVGSSPLTRGKPFGSVPNVVMSGLIPAHAGKTGDCRAYPACSTAHPRSRGENSPPLPLLTPRRGSSPLTRGKQASTACQARRSRLIPAHAGKTGTRDRPLPRGPAHPRSRGENQCLKSLTPWKTGSSPLTRGKRLGRRRLRARRRLIPAHAGKTSRRTC